tara:strand:+ start:153 stop:287 length:135 start_codon:yes stop_codon:yes gene_type:complete
MNLKKWLSDNKITEVECLVSDIAGIPRGKKSLLKSILILVLLMD